MCSNTCFFCLFLSNKKLFHEIYIDFLTIKKISCSDLPLNLFCIWKTITYVHMSLPNDLRTYAQDFTSITAIEIKCLVHFLISFVHGICADPDRSAFWRLKSGLGRSRINNNNNEDGSAFCCPLERPTIYASMSSLMRFTRKWLSSRNDFYVFIFLLVALFLCVEESSLSSQKRKNFCLNLFWTVLLV